ncbi:FAD-dependent oxidoreductase [Nesterenkonia pannonica]|uniref:FAD-dependent oxidoreductase n=1 Tax=Nesterenkonia pannonica TaxID=1548602 RepID=UPI00216422ED|nr:FAD-dependent oxidoreductase [Nesterenkonia pannonica]
MPDNAKHAIVVGAGLAGLAAAVDLVDAGHRVTVLERAEQVGGRTSSWKADGMTVESGLHRFMSSFTATTDLIRRTGTDLEDIVVWEDEVEIITPDGGPKAEFGASVVHRPIKSVGEALGNNDFLPMTEKAKLGKMLAAAAKQHSREDESLDGLSVQEFALKHGLAEATIDRILAPLTDGLFSVPADQFSMATFMNLTSSYWDTSPSSRVGAFAGPMTEVLAEPIAEYLRTRSDSPDLLRSRAAGH